MSRTAYFIRNFYNINYKFKRAIKQKVLPFSELLPLVKLSFLQRKMTIILLYRIKKNKEVKPWGLGDLDFKGLCNELFHGS